MAGPSRKAYTLVIGDTQLSTADIDPERVIMPSAQSSYIPEEKPSDNTSTNPNTIFIVFQHSSASGYSALLPFSNIVGVFQTQKEACEFMHGLKEKDRPLVKDQSVAHPRIPNFWNTSDGEDGDELGFRYTSEYGEGYVVWIEQHEIRSKQVKDGGEKCNLA